MKQKLGRRLCAAVCLAAILTGSAGAVGLAGVSDENKTIVQYADKAELLPWSMDEQNADTLVTKEQLCAVAVRVYASVKEVSHDSLVKQAGSRLQTCPYTDTDSEDVRLAWVLGLTTNKGTLFRPDETVSEQLMDTMLYRALRQAQSSVQLSKNQITEQISACKDGEQIAKWAREAVAYFLLQGLRSTDSKSRLRAEETVSCEQLAVMAYKTAKAGHNTIHQSSAEKVATMSTHSGQDKVSWTNCDADSYRVYYYDSKRRNDQPLYIDLITYTKSGTIESILPGEIQKQKGTYYWSVDAFDSDGRLIGSTSKVTMLKITNPVSFSWTPQTIGDTVVSSSAAQAAYASGLGYAGESYQSKCRRIFGTDSFRRYSTESEAVSHQTTITVPVWRLGSNGSKYGSTASLSVNKGVASTVKQIFQEIYNDKERFPIKDVGGYNWRGGNISSEHTQGLAIDINWNENYMCTNDGSPLTGAYWRPGSDPYSIPANSSVVRIFAKYGFVWGGTWHSKKDYMHFSFFGT